MAGEIERELIGGMTRSGKYPRVIRSSVVSVGTGVTVNMEFPRKTILASRQPILPESKAAPLDLSPKTPMPLRIPVFAELPSVQGGEGAVRREDSFCPYGAGSFYWNGFPGLRCAYPGLFSVPPYGRSADVISPARLAAEEISHRFLPHIRLVDEVHVAGVGEDDEF